MRWRCLLLWMIAALPSAAQSVDWSIVNVNSNSLSPQLKFVRLSAVQQAAIKDLILADLADKNKRMTDCTEPTISGNDLLTEEAPVGRPGIVYVTAHLHCWKDHMNGTHWLMDIAGDAPHILAGQRQQFEGWGLGIQARRNKGLSDVVLGALVGASEMRLSYFRFEGTAYRKLDEQKVVYCKSLSGHETETGRCFSNGQRAFDSSKP